MFKLFISFLFVFVGHKAFATSLDCVGRGDGTLIRITGDYNKRKDSFKNFSLLFSPGWQLTNLTAEFSDYDDSISKEARVKYVINVFNGSAYLYLPEDFSRDKDIFKGILATYRRMNEYDYTDLECESIK